MTRKITENDFDAFMRQFRNLILGVIAVLVVPLLLYALYLNWRLDSFEDTLKYRPPQAADGSPDGDPDALASNPVQGQVVYVPAYSHIYHDDGDAILLTITLSIRNTSLDDEILVKSVRYFDTAGQEVKSYLEKPLRLGPLATTEFLIDRDDTSGGSGANFLVEWVANAVVTAPIIEAVMIDTEGQQGISFARGSTVVKEILPNPGDAENNEADPSE